MTVIDEHSNTMDIDNDGNMENIEYLQIQMANNILKAAYKEFMTIAYNANTWVQGIPAMGSVDEFQSMFQRSPPPGMTVECSVECAVVPLVPGELISVLMDPYRWPLLLPPIVRQGSRVVPPDFLQKLEDCDAFMTSLIMVNAEFQLPTPNVPTRKFCFLRCQKEIIKDIWAIFDVSVDYFDNMPNSELTLKNLRRPSGVIIRSQMECSEIIWIENVEVPKYLVEDNIFSTMVNSNLTFCAKRWVNTLLQRLKRNGSMFTNLKMQVKHAAGSNMVALTNHMEMNYSDCTSEAPNESRWVILSDKGVRILRKTIADNAADTLGVNSYVALTSFRVSAKPLSVFNFLVKRNIKLQWHGLQNPEEPEEVIKLATEDESYCVTLLGKVDSPNDSKCDEYMLQEAVKDEFCSMVISSPMTQIEADAFFFMGMATRADLKLKPSGFAIMPDGSGDLHSDASLVTIVMRQELYVSETDQVVEAMSNLISTTINEINEAVASEGRTPRKTKESTDLRNQA